MRGLFVALATVMVVGCGDGPRGGDADVKELVVCCHRFAPCGECDYLLTECIPRQERFGTQLCTGATEIYVIDCDSECIPRDEWVDPVYGDTAGGD